MFVVDIVEAMTTGSWKGSSDDDLADTNESDEEEDGEGPVYGKGCCDFIEGVWWTDGYEGNSVTSDSTEGAEITDSCRLWECIV